MTATTTITTINPVNAFRAVETAGADLFLERSNELHGLNLAALSGSHIFFVGPPGTAKSAMLRWYSERLSGAKYFSWLLTRFSTPEELFGPIDLQALKNGSYRRITSGKMPEAETALLDEIFKANSAILNALLSLLQERLFYNDGNPTKCPLIFAAGASNELPEDDDALDALYDRFLLRYRVQYLQQPASFAELLIKFRYTNQNQVNIPRPMLDAARQAVSTVILPDTVSSALVDLRRDMQSEGVIASDRRWVQSVRVLQAEAWLSGRTEINLDDLGILSHTLWTSPDDEKKVAALCMRIANPHLLRATQILEAARDAAGKILSVAGDKRDTTAAVQVAGQIKKLLVEFTTLAGNSAAVQPMLVELKGLQQRVIRDGVGLDFEVK